MRWCLACLGLLLALITLGASAASPKRVLILNPFGRDVAPFNAAVSAFRITLPRELGEPVDFHEVPLELGRFSGPEGEAPLVLFLEGRIKSQPVDLVVTIGGAGAQFAGRHRERLFPVTPVLVVAAEPRLVPPDLLRTNATLVAQRADLPGIVEDILQLQPQTTNIAVVFGSSALEQFWVNQCRQEFQRFTNRVGFTWMDDLSLDQVLGQCAHLPPRSFIFHGFYLMDAAGFSTEKNEALRRLHAVANAPLFGYFESEFGLGPIGGRLFQDAKIGEEGGRTAARILRGERPENISPQVLPESAPVYDVRELRRWGISESRLPTGSKVLFREPSTWERYKWRIILVTSLCLIEAVLIFVLMASLQQRRRAERSLVENQNRLRAILDTSVEGIVTINERGIIESVNAATEKIFGYSAAEMIGQNVSILMPSPFREEHDGYLGNYRRTHEPKIIGIGREVAGRRKDGLVFPMDLSVSEIRLADRRVFTGFVRDISERKRLEEESRHRAMELAHVTRVSTLGELSGSLAHELYQPLGIILSNAQAAQELLTQEPPDVAEVQAILADIVKADRRAGEVIERLRALFKGGQGSLQQVSLNAVIDEVLRLIQAELIGRGVAVIRELAPDLPLVTGDRVQLQQLVLNLILNAADAMAANAPGTRRLHLKTMLHQEHVRASVRDEGEGLPADMERIFQPLYTTKPRGLGLGLTICLSIVGAHNGRLWAERHPERGAVLHFELPLNGAASKT